MKFDELSSDAKNTLTGMVDYCINNRVCMGIDEGADLTSGEDHPFVTELREFALTIYQ